MNEILNQEKSIYIQISEMIENDILRDVLLEDERVPSTNELAKLYAINPATAAKGVNIHGRCRCIIQEKRDRNVCKQRSKRNYTGKTKITVL